MFKDGSLGPLKYQLLKKSGLGPRIEANYWFGHPRVLNARKLLMSNKYDELEGELSTVRLENPELYSLYLGGLSQFTGNPSYIHSYMDKFPRSVHAHIVTGRSMTEWAWEGRTANAADQVTDEQWEAFFSRLKIARSTLENAVAIDPANAESYSALITVTMGDSHGIDDIYSIFTEVKTRSPNHIFAHSSTLYALTQRWHGSDDAMFSFARNTIKQAQPGNPLGALIAQAHIEKWFSLLPDYYDEDTSEADNYITDLNVMEELESAYQASLNNENYQHGVLTPAHASLFAMAFYLAGNYKLTRINCAKLLKGFPPYPWYYLAETDNDHLNAGYILDRIMKQIK